MQSLKLLPALCLAVSLIACKRPDPIRLQPTIEEAAPPASIVRTADAATAGQLLRGFYALEQNSWRWTSPHFAVLLGTTSGARRDGATLDLRFALPEQLIQALKTVTVSANVGATALAPEKYTTSGDHEYRRDVPASAFRGDSVTAQFTVDKSLTPPNETRNLALVVFSIGLEAK